MNVDLFSLSFILHFWNQCCRITRFLFKNILIYFFKHIYFSLKTSEHKLFFIDLAEKKKISKLFIIYNYFQQFNDQKKHFINAHFKKIMNNSVLLHTNCLIYMDISFKNFIDTLHNWWSCTNINLSEKMYTV